MKYASAAVLLVMLISVVALNAKVPKEKDQPKEQAMENLNSKNTSLVVIDVQNYFIPGTPGAISPAIPGQDEAGKLSNVLSLVRAAKKFGMNTFVTYEASDQGVNAMPDRIKAELPAENCWQFIKAYFDLTKKPELSAALEEAGTRNIVVCGAETDVCVLQSVTGLVKKGYAVYLAEDAVYTSTTLNGPALKRMEMAGASIVKTAELLKAIENSTKPAVENRFARLEDIPDISADRVAAVIVNYDDDSLGRVSDPKAEQKKLRIKYLNHFAEVLEIPVFYLYKGRIEKVKKSLYLYPQAQFLEVAGAFQDSIRELAAGLKNSKISQVMLGGVDEGQVVADAALILKKSGLEVQLMEDVYLETEGAPGPGKLDRLYHSGIVPSSFKIFVYDATGGIQSVLPKRWREMFREKLNKKEILWVDELPFVRDSQ